MVVALTSKKFQVLIEEKMEISVAEHRVIIPEVTGPKLRFIISQIS